MPSEIDAKAAAVKAATDALEAAKAEHASAIKNAPPRAPEVVVTEILTRLVERDGNHPALQALLDELQKATAPAKAEPEPQT